MITATAQIAEAQRALGHMEGAAERAMARALNRSSVAGRQVAVDKITERYAVRASDVRDKITLSTATPSNLVSAVSIRSPALSLAYFPHSPTEPGTGGKGKPLLRAEVLRGSPKPITGAFVARVTGGLRIFRRTGKKTSTGKEGLEALRSISFAAMLGVESVREAVESRALEMLDARLAHEIDHELGKVP